MSKGGTRIRYAIITLVFVAAMAFILISTMNVKITPATNATACWTVKTIPLSYNPILVAATSKYLYVLKNYSPPTTSYASISNSTISVISTANNTLIKQIKLNYTVYNLIIVNNSLYAIGVYYTSIISTSNNTVLKKIIINVTKAEIATDNNYIYGYNTGIVFSGNYMYGITGYGNTISVIWPYNFSIIKTISVDNGTYSIAANNGYVYVDSDGSAYTNENAKGEVVIISSLNNTVVKTIPTGYESGGSIAATGNYVYLAHSNGAISVISTTNYTTVKTIGVGLSPADLKVNKGYIYTTLFGESQIAVISPSANFSVVKYIPVYSAGPYTPIATTDNHLYIASGADNISAINTTNC